MKLFKRDRANRAVVEELADLIAQVPGVEIILIIDSGIGARDWSVHALLHSSLLGWAALQFLTSALRDPSRADGHVDLVCQGILDDHSMVFEVTSCSSCGVEPETAIERLSGSRETADQADDEDVLDPLIPWVPGSSEEWN